MNQAFLKIFKGTFLETHSIFKLQNNNCKFTIRTHNYKWLILYQKRTHGIIKEFRYENSNKNLN